MTPDEMAEAAESLCERSDAATMDDRERRAERIAMKAMKLFREAARLATDPARGRYFLRAAQVAETLEAPGTVCSLVREACRYDPDYETVEEFRELWDGWAWAASRAADPPPFPEPAPAGSRTLLDRDRPIAGQLELFGGGEGVARG